MMQGVLLVLVAFLSGALMIAGFVVTLIKLSKPGKQKHILVWGLLTAFCLIVCVFSGYLIVKKITGKAFNFSQELIENSLKQLNKMEEQSQAYNKLTTENNEIIIQLKSWEPDSLKEWIFPEFYSYLGFRDYYRLPLRFPFSIHCMEVPDAGTLYNEINVLRFDENNNGEIKIDIENITSFAQNKNFLVGSYIDTKNQKNTKLFFSYEYDKNKINRYATEKELRNFMKNNGFKDDEALVSCESYFNNLSSYSGKK